VNKDFRASPDRRGLQGLRARLAQPAFKEFKDRRVTPALPDLRGQPVPRVHKEIRDHKV
jgi:hypothetical protein